MKEQCFRYEATRQQVRPFQEMAQVHCRGYSRRLERIMVDFGADDSFAKAAEKIQEHYGLQVPVGAVQEKTFKHAQQILQQGVACPPLQESGPGVETVISQSDGTMVPLVEIPAGIGDGRKRRQVLWKEAISTLAYPQGSKTPVYAATLEGREEAGCQMQQTAWQAGLGHQTRVHALGDGASWIPEKVEFHFGQQAHYLIDFYHLCDYLHQAVQATSVGNKPSYLGRIKAGFKQGHGERVIQWLKPFVEPVSRPNADAPVRAALRYVDNRPGQFEYQRAIAQDLPIGSGEIESTHRHLIQKRLKISGAWWKEKNANAMLYLRTCRANKKWNLYWNSGREKHGKLFVPHTFN